MVQTQTICYLPSNCSPYFCNVKSMKSLSLNDLNDKNIWRGKYLKFLLCQIQFFAFHSTLWDRYTSSMHPKMGRGIRLDNGIGYQIYLEFKYVMSHKTDLYGESLTNRFIILWYNHIQWNIFTKFLFKITYCFFFSSSSFLVFFLNLEKN